MKKKKWKEAIQQVDTDRNGGDERRAAEGFRDASLTLQQLKKNVKSACGGRNP
jgi:hypothetical protein